MTTVARNELIEGLKRDMYEFWFLDGQMGKNLKPIYSQIFTSSPIRGNSEVRNSAMLNVTFKETNDREVIEYTDASSGRKFVGRLRRYTAATQIERDLIDKDASKETLRNFLQQWQQGAQKQFGLHKEQYYANLINYAGYTAGNAVYNNTSEMFTDPGAGLAYDGLPLLTLVGAPRTLLKVPVGITNSFSNSLGASGVPLTSDNFDLAYTKVASTNAINDAGQREMQFPTHLLVNPALRTEAFQILKTVSGVPGDVNNGANQNFGIVEPVMNPFISGTTSWYLISNNGKWLCYDQEPPIFDMWFDQDHKVYRVSIDVRFGHCFMSWQNVSGGNIATS